MKEWRIWGHLVNDNRDKLGRKGSPLKRGTYYLHLWNVALCWSWSFFRHFCHLEVATGMERDITFSVAVPGAAFWFTIENVLPWKWMPKHPHRLGVSIHDWTIWFNLWQNDHEWNPKRDRFRSFNFCIPDFFLGWQNYTKEILCTERVVIPMPEGGYPATVEMFESTWKRPRWPFAKKMVRAEVTPDTPIPFPGKGENSWDCGDNAMHSLTTAADSIPAAIAATVESVLRSREKYGGRDWRPKASA